MHNANSIDETLIRTFCQEGCFSFPDDYTINFSRDGLSITANATFTKEVISDVEYLHVFSLLNIKYGMEQTKQMLTFLQPLSFRANPGASHWLYLGAVSPSESNAQTPLSSITSLHGLFASTANTAQTDLKPEILANALHPNLPPYR